MRVSSWLLLVLAIWAGGSGAQSATGTLQDGPYVTRSGAGHWVARWVEGTAHAPQVREQAVKPGDSITVPAVGTWPAFEVKLRGEPSTAADEIDVSERVALFVMADTHGEFDIAVQLLRRQHVIDEQLRWSFGNGRLAILGDVFDRGPNQTELLWLIYKLEAEASRAGGGVHMAIGNHEVMVLTGDDRYLNPKYQRVASVLRASSHAELWSEQSVLGRWLRAKAAVFRLGPYLCLHGGISRELVDRRLTLAEINNIVRASLRGQPISSESTGLVMGLAGPLWYRGYFEREARAGGFTPAQSSDVDLVLATFKVRAVLVGHTTVPTVTSLYGGRVIAVQVYPHRDKDTDAAVLEALSVRRGQMFRAFVDGSSEPLSR
jgi:Calcineurin-like phosphoesterase